MSSKILLSLSLFSLCLAGVVRVNDPNWYFTEWNWYRSPDGSFVQSANPGSYFKVGFTGTSAALLIDTTKGPSYNFMKVRYSVDNAPYVDVELSSAFGETLNITKGLPQGSHSLVFWIKASNQFVDRWWNGPADRLLIKGLIIDNGANTVAPSLRPKRIMSYWDSIGEGVRVLGGDPKGWNDLADNDGTSTWEMSLAAALNAEISVVAFGGQGYINPGAGSVVPLITPGDQSQSAWNQFSNGLFRYPPGEKANHQPDYVYCGHGTNDHGRPDADVTARSVAWMTEYRKVNNKTTIFLVVPFGQFKGDAIRLAYKEYVKNSGDNNAYLIDLGDEGAQGLDGKGTSLFSYDGVHPLWQRDGQLGAMLAQSTQVILDRRSRREKEL